MRKIIVTGGAGFIASHICDSLLLAYPAAEIVIVDKLTYAGNIENLSDALSHPRVQFIQADICDYNVMLDVTRDADWVIHAAAESSVEHSFSTPLIFTQTNVIGTHTVMECCRQNSVPKIFHISTDEVYGEVLKGQDGAHEEAPLNPTTPYAASKGAADLIIQSYRTTYRMPITILRPCNVYGTRQYPEKIIPKFCLLLSRGQKLPIQGNPLNSRFYLSVHDLCSALLFIAQQDLPCGTYNISSGEEHSTLSIASLISKQFGLTAEETMQAAPDRPYHDQRYFMDGSKLRDYGWKATEPLHQAIEGISQWYRDNAAKLLARMAS